MAGQGGKQKGGQGKVAQVRGIGAEEIFDIIDEAHHVKPKKKMTKVVAEEEGEQEEGLGGRRGSQEGGQGGIQRTKSQEFTWEEEFGEEGEEDYDDFGEEGGDPSGKFKNRTANPFAALSEDEST
jgi:hypothetical protein